MRRVRHRPMFLRVKERDDPIGCRFCNRITWSRHRVCYRCKREYGTSWMARLPMLGEPPTAEDTPTLLPNASIGTTAMVASTFGAGLIGAFATISTALNYGGVSVESMLVIVAAFVVASCVAGGLNGLFFRFGQRRGPSVIVKSRTRYIVGMCASSILSIILQSVVVPMCALLGSVGGESIVGGFVGAGFGMFAVAAAIGRVSSDAFVRVGALTSIKPGDDICLMCNYDLRGAASLHCPECGARVPPRETGPPNDKDAGSGP